MYSSRKLNFRRAGMTGLLCALCLAVPAAPAPAQENMQENAQENATKTAEKEATPETQPEKKHECRRTTLSHAITLARSAIAAASEKSDDADDVTEMHVEVLSAELAITAVPRYYDIILFDDDRNYFARVDEATNRVLNLTRPGQAREDKIAREADSLHDTNHIPIEEIIAGAQESRPRGIPTSARLSHIYGPQPVYEVIMRMPPGNDEVLLVGGLSGQTIELENFE